MSEQQRAVDAICREILRIDELHHASQDQQGDAALWARLQWDGEIIGLRKALCALHGWPMEEAAKEGKADQLVETWTADQPENADPANSDEPQPVDDGLCHATLQGWPHTTVIRCAREAGHYDEAQEPDFISSDEPEPGGWHQSEPGEDGNRTTWADRADGATPHEQPVRPDEETTP